MDIVNELIILYDFKPEEATKIALKYEKEGKVDDLYEALSEKKIHADSDDVCVLQS